VTTLKLVLAAVFACQTDQPLGVGMSAMATATPATVHNSSVLGSVRPWTAAGTVDPVVVWDELLPPPVLPMSAIGPHPAETAEVRAMVAPDVASNGPSVTMYGVAPPVPAAGT
jgi:hypothetical protein